MPGQAGTAGERMSIAGAIRCGLLVPAHWITARVLANRECRRSVPDRLRPPRAATRAYRVLPCADHGGKAQDSLAEISGSIRRVAAVESDARILAIIPGSTIVQAFQ